MPANRTHGMITLNHQLDWCKSQSAGCDVPDALVGDQSISPEQRLWCKRLLDYYVQTCKPLHVTYGVAVCELGTEEDSNNWHIHVAFKGSYGPQKAPQCVQNLMKKIILDEEYPKDDPTAATHINITYKHEQGAKGIWQWNDMVKYLIEPSKKKRAGTPHFDEYPLFFGQLASGEPCTHENIYDEEDENVDTADTIMQSMAELAHSGERLDKAILKANAYAQNEDRHMYNRLIDYYKTQPCRKPKLCDAGLELYDWQQSVKQWVDDKHSPYQGLWLHLPSGSGKTTFLRWLIDNKVTFIPGMRPSGNFDCLSLMNYKEEPIMLFNEMEPSLIERFDYDNGGITMVPKWKRAVIELLKRVTDEFPIAFQFGGVHSEITPMAKIIITSNYPLPPEQSGALARRYLVVDSVETAMAYKPSMSPKKRKLIEDFTPPLPLPMEPNTQGTESDDQASDSDEEENDEPMYIFKT